MVAIGGLIVNTAQKKFSNNQVSFSWRSYRFCWCFLSCTFPNMCSEDDQSHTSWLYSFHCAL